MDWYEIAKGMHQQKLHEARARQHSRLALQDYDPQGRNLGIISRHTIGEFVLRAIVLFKALWWRTETDRCGGPTG